MAKPKPVQEFKKGTANSVAGALPPGLSINDLTYKGRPAKDVVDDFGPDVGIADMACVNQFGDANNAKYYHAGVVQAADGRWFTYYQWGRIHPGKSWNGTFQAKGGTFQFVQWSCEADARFGFEAKCQSKNIKRLEQRSIGGVTVWASKTDKKGKVKDGYIVQSLATRERGLPDAYTIKDDSGVQAQAPKKVTKHKRSNKVYQPEVIKLATDLVGGVKTYARAQAAATGITPTQDAIDKVRDQFIPAALNQISRVGNNLDDQIRDQGLIDISKMVRGMVPMTFPVSRSASAQDRARAAILSAGNILSLQNDLDAFEAALRNEDWDENQTSDTDPTSLLNATLNWLSPTSRLGRWVTETIISMSNNRHGHLRGKLKVKNVFSVTRPDRDIRFIQAVEKVATKNQHKRINNFARLQPRTRDDLSDVADMAPFANIFLGIHGTRPVNIAPILQTNLRLPKSLSGVQITGAAFGHGIYWATDFRKSHGYTGHGQSYWASGGQIAARKGTFFLFLSDVIMGDAYMAQSTGSWSKPPQDKDSIAAFPRVSSVANDEHIIFDPNYQRIRYLVEGTF